MRTNRIVSGVAAVVAAAGLIGTGAALSNAASTPSPSSTSTSTAGTGSEAGSEAGPDRSMNPNNDTPVTGTELAGVTAAVKAKDASVTVTSVRRDPDGSYDVLGTRSGADVMLEVSKDLKTITADAGGPRG